MRGTNVCIWRIENTLEHVLPLMIREYYRDIPELINCAIPDNEKKYIYKLKSILGQPFITKNKVISGLSIPYVEAIGALEMPSMPVNSIFLPDTGQPLPKHLWVNTFSNNLIFTKHADYVNCIVYGSKSLEGPLRSNIFGSRKKESDWGPIIFNNVPGFYFDTSFYYWILRSKGQYLVLNDKSMLLQDVAGFRSNTERDAYSYTGQGSNIDQQIPLKSLISMDEKLVSLYIKIVYDRISYSFYLDYDGRLSVVFSECGEHGTETPTIIDNSDLLLTIYFDIIPFLKQLYNTAELNDWLRVNELYRKAKSVEVITELMHKNGVSITDIQQALEILIN